ncbi:urea amidolyase associated protein UAAP2 [Isoalcanivorax indicus]|uniref:urea amidolyase associated protein UAAP2 n=1 Tax=Isoalcanivorax indicus TaxID=2202653 RepID=UPI000DB94011|nr:urea amidolyase associated protein UAAP2 [Isoalcanivorax indicus]
MIRESERTLSQARERQVVDAGDYYIGILRAGETLRITDLEGNQAADTLFYNAADPAERYSATDTICQQGNVYLGAGSVLISSRGNPMLDVVADTCGRHDTVGGACASESNTVRYDLARRCMHSCRDSWMLAIAEHEEYGLDKRDITHNINFFMNVPITADGGLQFADGISAPGKYVELTARMDVIVLMSNCPQLNNPCNGYNPTPVELAVWDH